MNRPPKIIWLQWNNEDEEFGVTWCEDQINDDDIGYTLIDIPADETKEQEE